MVSIGERMAALLWAKLIAERTALAKLNHQTEFQAKDGLGGDGMSITETEFFAARLIYGPQCWSDPDFKKAYLRDNPECRTKVTRGTKGQAYKGTRGPLPPGTLFVPPHVAAQALKGSS